MAGKTTSTSTAQPANEDVNNFVSTIAQGMDSAYQPGGTTYVGPSDATKSSWAMGLDAAGNPIFSGGVKDAMSSFARRASGAEIGADNPIYAAMRNRITGDTLKAVNGSYNNSGLFGSDQNQNAAARGVSEGLASFDNANLNADYARQSEAASKLGELYQASLMPSSVTGAVGAAQDANAAAEKNGGIDYIKQFMDLLNGATNSAGTTTTEEIPWWRAILGGGATIGGLAGGN